MNELVSDVRSMAFSSWVGTKGEGRGILTGLRAVDTFPSRNEFVDLSKFIESSSRVGANGDSSAPFPAFMAANLLAADSKLAGVSMNERVDDSKSMESSSRVGTATPVSACIGVLCCSRFPVYRAPSSLSIERTLPVRADNGGALPC